MRKAILILLLMVSTNSYAQISCFTLDGASVYSNESQSRYLGFFGNSFAYESIMNRYGPHGSQFSLNSVRNPYGTYGSQFNSYSATNPYTSSPPRIIKNNQLIGYLTNNTIIAGGVSLAQIDAACSFNLSAPASTILSVPGALSGLQAISGDTSIGLTWVSTIGASSYDVYAALTQSGEKTFLQSTTMTSFIATGAAPGTVYYFFVYPVNSVGTGTGMWTSASISPPMNKLPSATIIGGNRTVADTNQLAGEKVTFRAIVTDDDGTIITTQWLLNGVVVSTGTSATLELPDGVTVVTLRATDNKGAATSTTATITVTDPDGTDPNWLGTYNSISTPIGYNLEFNTIGNIVLSREQLHSCVKILEDGKLSSINGMSHLDVTFKIVSLDEGIIRLIGSRDFGIHFKDTGKNPKSIPDCSGRFEVRTGEYRDLLKLGDQIFDVTFKMTDEIQLEFILTSAIEMLPQ